MNRFSAAFLLFLLPTPLALAGSESQAVRVEGIFDLAPVQDVSVTDQGEALITLEKRATRFSTFPLAVTGEVEFELSKPRAVMLHDDTLVVLGDQDPTTVDGGVFYIYPNFSASLHGPIEKTSVATFGDPFSQVLSVDGDTVYAVSPTWLAAMRLSAQEALELAAGTSAKYEPAFLFLQCGKATQISIFKYREREFYVTSVVNEKAIEYGRVQTDNLFSSSTNCFNVDSFIQASGKQVVGGDSSSILHSLVKPFLPFDPMQVLVLDAEAGLLSLFPTQEYARSLAILRSEVLEFDLRRISPPFDTSKSRFGLLASDIQGKLILVSYVGSTFVHRFKLENRNFSYLGALRFRNNVHHLAVSPSGNMASIVTATSNNEDQEGLYEVTLVQHLANLPAGANLPLARHSIMKLQESLEEAGFPLYVDGILGTQTRGALDNFMTNTELTKDDRIKMDLIETTTRGVFPLLK
ncbi:hypothetical protein [uncultured Roseibium sp.]|uniref:hypothetical protein n=1 Tax=uncultured Roseibium sp. TaxID=1936171 RepID=UPI00262ACFA2|nr:hypothetical protein [uncultured Roseibium sp.]